MKLKLVYLLLLTSHSPATPDGGTGLRGDFDGDGQTEVATVVRTKVGQGNPVEDGTPDAYEVRFSNQRKPIPLGCCGARLLNEGDLNDDHTDELSVYQAPMNGCVYSLETYGFARGRWRQVVHPFLIPTGCAELSESKLQQRVRKEGRSIYYYETDVNSKVGLLHKRKAGQQLISG